MILNKINKIISKNLLKISKIKTKPINRELHSFYVTIIFGFLLTGIFSVLPVIKNHTSKMIFNAKLIDNTSKIDFDYKEYTNENVNKFNEEFNKLKS